MYVCTCNTCMYVIQYCIFICGHKLKVLGKSVGGLECKSAKLWGEMVKELSDSVTETQILQKLSKK